MPQLENFYKSPEYYMSLALSQANIALSLGEIPVGCVIVDKAGRIVGQGCNMTIINSDPTAHAEIMALRNAGVRLKNYRLVDLDMYVTLEPCCMCSGAIIHARLKHVYFGATDPKTGACGSMFNVLNDLRHNHHPNITGGILKDECSEILKSFFKMRRKMKKEGRDWLKERGKTRDWLNKQ